MRKYQLENPSNSRIFIDFKNKSNPVSFSYPNKSKGFKIASATFYALWFRFCFIIIFPINIILVLIFRPSSHLFLTLLPLQLFVPPLLLGLLFSTNKKLILTLPKLNKWISSGDIKRILVKNLNSKIYEIPIFDNVYLEYKATEDFGKYLSKIEVVEHEFYYLQKKLFRKIERVQNDEYWKAKFIFSKIPKRGELNIEYI